MKIKLSKLFIVRIFILLGMFVTGLILLPSLPETVPVHWGFEGNADGWAPKVWGTFMSPLLTLVMVILFPLLSKLDPKKENYKDFEKAWDILQTVFIVFFAYVFALQMYMSMEPEKGDLMGRLIMAGIGVLFVFIGNLLGKIRQNYFIGIKTPWTFQNKEVWQKSQRLGGWVMVLCGVGFIIEAIVWQFVIPVFIVFVTAMIVVPTIYSYLLSKRLRV